MQINIDILLASGAVFKKYKKGDYVFEEGNHPYYFFQIVEGEIKVISTLESGKELIQGIFAEGESFGEPPLILQLPYPCSAISLGNSLIIRISYDSFISMLDKSPLITKSILSTLCKRVYQKSNMAIIHTSISPEHKILSFLKMIKKDAQEPVKIQFTRQQIADITGLRVETVIRTLKSLEDQDKLSIINHKIHF